MLYLDDLDEVISLLEEGKTILIPTDSGWCVCHSAKYVINLDYLGNDNIKQPDDQLIMVSTPEMFQTVVPELHPRIQTLLGFHQHALALEFPNEYIDLEEKPEDKLLYVKMSSDEYCQGLIEKYNHPIWAHRIFDLGQEVLEFESIPATVLNSVAYISQHHGVHTEFALPVIARYNNKAVLDFIRE